MAFWAGFLPTAVVVAGLSIAPGVHAEYWHGHGHPTTAATMPAPPSSAA